MEVANEILAPDFVLHDPLLPKELRNGPEETKKNVSAIISAVPDRKLVDDDFFAKGDKVLIRWTNSGTNTGPLFGNPAPSFFSSSIRLVNCCSSSMSSSHSFPILDFLLHYSIEKMFTSVGFVIFTLYDSGIWVTVTPYSAVLNVFTVDRYLRVYESH